MNEVKDKQTAIHGAANRRTVDALVRLPFQFVESCAVNGLLSRMTWQIAFHSEPVWRVIFRMTPAKWICGNTVIGDWVTEMYGSSVEPNTSVTGGDAQETTDDE